MHWAGLAHDSQIASHKHQGQRACLSLTEQALTHACAGLAGKLLVNFDKGLAQTMAEAKALARLGLALPEAAHTVLLQEEKFQVYYETLSHALKVSTLICCGAAVTCQRPCVQCCCRSRGHEWPRAVLGDP